MPLQRVPAPAGIGWSLADRPKSPILGRLTKPVRWASRAGEGLAPLASFLPGPGYGREPVGNGHAAAGFSAVLAPGVAAVDGGEAGAGAVGAAGLAW